MFDIRSDETPAMREKRCKITADQAVMHAQRLLGRPGPPLLQLIVNDAAGATPRPLLDRPQLKLAVVDTSPPALFVDRKRGDGTQYYVGPPCKYGHDGLRYIKSHGCVHCCRTKASVKRQMKVSHKPQESKES